MPLPLPRQKPSPPQLGRALALLMMLCHLSAVSAQLRLATNVQCLPNRNDEGLLDFSGAKPQRFLLCAHLSVANVRRATNVACLTERSEEIFFDLSGARACHSAPQRISPALTLTDNKRVYFGEGSISKTGMGWPAAKTNCLALQDMWKLASLELRLVAFNLKVRLVNFDLKLALKQCWLISLLAAACFLGAQALARARDARTPGDGRNRCAHGRASAASPRQNASLPRLGGPLRPVLVLCHLSAVSAQQRLATNVACLPIRSDEALLDFSGAKPQRFLYTAHPPG